MRAIFLFACLWPITVSADASVPPRDRRLDTCIAAVHDAVARYYVPDPQRDGRRCASSPGALDCYGCTELISEHNDVYDWVVSLQIELTAAKDPPRPWTWYPYDEGWEGDWERIWHGIHATVRIQPCKDDDNARDRAKLRRQAELARRALDRCLEAPSGR